MKQAADKPGREASGEKPRFRLHLDGTAEIDPTTERRRSPRSKD